MSHLLRGVEQICRSTSLPLVELEAGSGCRSLFRLAWSPTNGASLTTGGRFLVASITKPVVAVVALSLAEQGLFGLNDRIHQYLAEFDTSTFRRITIRHLLTHTSGLPDMLPGNTELRANHATLADYVTATAQCTPDFSPGTDCRYSSMGFALLGCILERLSGQSLKQLCKSRLFDPLGMQETWLGLDTTHAAELVASTIPCELPVWQSTSSDWNWNSVYWRTLGAPWGGLISTAGDLGVLARMILASGAVPDGLPATGDRILSAMTVETMCLHQTPYITGLPSTIADNQRWGLGWRLNWPDHAASFGDFVSLETVGHWGATGTLMWIDRKNDRYCVILTPQPYEKSADVIRRLSNFVTSAIPLG